MIDLFLNSSDAAMLKRMHIDAEMSEYERGHADAMSEWQTMIVAQYRRIRRLEKWNAYLMSACALFAMVAGMAIAVLARSGY